MATASFFKTLPPDNDLRQDGADSRPGIVPFQMVPAGGSRPGEITIAGGIVRIASLDESIVKVAPSLGLPPAKVITFTQSGSFALIGQKSGRTVVVAEDQNGTSLASLGVSVKDQVSVTYHLLRLKDAVRDDAMERSQAETILKNVEQLYLNQTNVKLTKVASQDLFVQRVLSDSAGVLQLDDNKEEPIFEQIVNDNLNRVDVVFVFTWNIEGGSLIPIVTTGVQLDGRCETPSNAPKRIFARKPPTVIYINTFARAGQHSFTAAHELGHHFGMSHLASSIITRRPPNYLMEPPARSFKMTQNDINTANQTGT